MNAQPKSRIAKALKSRELQMQKTCQTCSNVLNSDSSPTRLRCGQSYFDQPVHERRPARMDIYPVVNADDQCQNWQTRHGLVPHLQTNLKKETL
jgi:hypothetical protein